ncbi:MAG: GspH/FimT family pseudopilin [Rhodocyclaceae bacterium]|nr:GspH/FimT family pseudopilin [Rhodocyclaceae bacterium]
MSRSAGFTLVELVMVLVVMGILAATAIPSMTGRRTVDAPGYADQVRQSLKYGRRLAVSQRRNVCVAAGAAGLVLTQALVSGSGSSCVKAVGDPLSGTALNLVPPGGIALSSSAPSFVFDGQGRLVGGAVTLSVAGDGQTRVITVESETGYSH